jgi:hypothetical protein
MLFYFHAEKVESCLISRCGIFLAALVCTQPQFMRALGDYVADDATGTERGDLWPAAKATKKIHAIVVK